MSQVVTTLTKKGDSSVEIYPNIKADNIPSASIDASKLASNSVTTAKIADEAITEYKIAEDAIHGFHILNGAVGTSKIENEAVTHEKLDGKRYINQYEYDLSDADFSAYDVDGGLLNIEFNYNSNIQTSTFWDDIDEDLNIIKGGYFYKSSTYYVIVKAYKYNDTSINLLGVSSTGIKLVTLPISLLITTSTNFTYVNLI